MKSVLRDFGPEVWSSGDGLRSYGESVVRTTLNTRTQAELKPRSMVRPAESPALRSIPRYTHAGWPSVVVGEQVNWEIPARYRLLSDPQRGSPPRYG